jgi:NTP pyrophosphatase (non-canonical NTP hydrolase)
VTDLWEHAGAAYAWIRRSDRERRRTHVLPHVVRKESMRADRHLRLMKVSEELGEVTQAVIGVEGQNPRKGVTHSNSDVASELCDVILSAMVAMHDYTHNPEAFMDEYFKARADRIKGWSGE